MVKSYELYRLYQCPRCLHMEFDAYEYERTAGHTQRCLGICKFSKLPVRNDPIYGLLKAPPDCPNWSKGKARKVKRDVL